MYIELLHREKKHRANLAKPIDLSLPLANTRQAKCFFAPDFKAEPLVAGDFVGAVSAGAPINFFNVQLNPHGNGTHTECMGHISSQGYTINQQLQQFHFIARLVSVKPDIRTNGDQVLTLNAVASHLEGEISPALIIRTWPNEPTKRERDYSGTNPPYLELDLVQHLVALGIEHLLLDLPSIDRETDGGALAGHKAFWQFPSEDRLHCTVTEMIYVPNQIADGTYLLNLQIAAFELDASPSKPVLYALEPVD